MTTIMLLLNKVTLIEFSSKQWIELVYVFLRESRPSDERQKFEYSAFYLLLFGFGVAAIAY